MIGTILKRSTMCFVGGETYGINFPLDMDLNAKALVLWALFLIDILQFDEGCD